MVTFEYTITDPAGIHARPAGELVKKAGEYESRILLTKGEKTVELTKLMMLMSLGIKSGETVTISAEGADEEKAAAELEEFLQKKM